MVGVHEIFTADDARGNTSGKKEYSIQFFHYIYGSYPSFFILSFLFNLVGIFNLCFTLEINSEGHANITTFYPEFQRCWPMHGRLPIFIPHGKIL
jgi:hypothetical protein